MGELLLACLRLRKGHAAGESGLLLPATGTGVATTRLSAHGKFLAMAGAAVTPDVLQSPNIHRNFTSELPFSFKAVNDGAEHCFLRLRDRIRFRVQGDLGFGENGARATPPNAGNGGERNFHAFLRGEHDSGDTNHRKRK